MLFSIVRVGDLKRGQMLTIFLKKLEKCLKWLYTLLKMVMLVNTFYVYIILI